MNFDQGLEESLSPPLFDPKVRLLAGVLAGYDMGCTVAIASGLMTVPELHAASLRLELLSQLALGACRGKKRPTVKHFDTWLNRQLGGSNVVRMEDPPEDVFVLGIVTRWGGFQIFPGLWEEADKSIQLLLGALDAAPEEVSRSWMEPVLGLLRLSNAVAERSGLRRWQSATSMPRRPIQIHRCPDIKTLARRVTFTVPDLEEIGVAPEALAPFLLADSENSELLLDPSQETVQMRRPLLRVGDDYILSSPSAVSYALRHFIMCWAQERHLSPRLKAAMLKFAHGQLIKLASRKSRHGPQLLRLPFHLQGVAGICRSIVVAVARRHFLHYLVIGTDLDRLLRVGLIAPDEFSPDEVIQVAKHVEGVRKVIEAADFSAGHTVVVGGLLGQATTLPDISERKGWSAVGASLGDLAMLLQDPDSPQDRLFHLLTQKKSLGEQGYELPNYNGLLNLYQFWLEQNFSLRLSQSRHDRPAYVQIGTDYVRTYRQTRRRALDDHAAQLPGEGTLTHVQMSDSHAIYRSLRGIPAYVSVDSATQGELAFYMSVTGATLWVRVKPPQDKEARRPVYELWQSLQFLLYRALIQGGPCSALKEPLSEVWLDFSGLINQPDANSRADLSSGIHVESGKTPGAVEVRIDSGFLRNFLGVENQGEVLFLTAVLQAIDMLMVKGTEDVLSLADSARAALGGPSAKILHTLRIWNDVDKLLISNPAPTYQTPTDRISAARHASFTCLPSVSAVVQLDATATSIAINSCVNKLVFELQSKLRQWARRPTIEKLLGYNETLLRERGRWRASARAVRALYGLDEGTRTAQEAEQERAQMQLTLRALIEAATCECSGTSDKAPDDLQVDELVGLMVNLIDLGRNSDVMHFGLARSGMKLHPNGSYSLGAEILAELAEPFMAHSFGERFSEAAAEYEKLVRIDAPVEATPDDFVLDTPKFLFAWEEEYGMTFEAFRHIAGALQDIAVKKNLVVVDCTSHALFEASAASGASLADVHAFLHAFGLPRRLAWPASPPASAHRDVMPWRFERRLSISLRPLVLDDPAGTTFTYGLGTTRESLAYVLESIQRASFDKDVFHSKAMRSWLGGRVDELGRKFSESVASRLRLLGWEAETEVKLTRIGAPKNPDLGDVDVLAWRSDGRVLAIECKRLKASRSISEIAQNCNRFKGNVGDLLHKHLRRKGWLQTSPAKLANFCKISEAELHVDYPLVVNQAVPFKYLSSLPIPPSDVVVVDALELYLSAASDASFPT